MEKKMEDNNAADTKNVMGQDPARYEQGYGSFTEDDFEKKEDSHEPADTTGEAEKANIKTGMNEEKNTVSNTAAPSGNVVQNEINEETNK